MRAKKNLGQHFLMDKNVVAKIVQCLGPLTGKTIFEIGPGTGVLTEELRKTGTEVVALEFDKELGFALQKKVPGVHIAVGDALRFDFNRLRRKMQWIVGNLPYNVASPIMWNVARDAGADITSLFMVQKEVAKRVVSSPGSRQYGMLSVWIQNFVSPEILFDVKPTVFWPRPKVMSSVIRFNIRQNEVPGRSEWLKLERLIKVCFQKRRKQLGTILKPLVPKDNLVRVFGELNVDLKARPEDVSPDIYRRMAKNLSFQ